MMVQRSLSCRSLSDAKKAMLGSGIVVFVQFTVFLLVGTFLYLYYNGIEMQKDREFATYIVNDLPVGIKGILLAGVLSAAMSTLSSSINSLASSTLIDWFKKSDDLRLSKLFSFIWAIVLISIADQLASASDVANQMRDTEYKFVLRAEYNINISMFRK